MGSVIINMERKAKANKIRVAKGGFKFFDWQIAQSQVCFVPLYEKKKIYVCLSQVVMEDVYVLNAPSMGH